jgi:hypothetical protein
MAKSAILLLDDTESNADLGRAVSAMVAAKGVHGVRDDVPLIFDGAATMWPRWPSVPADSEHKAHGCTSRCRTWWPAPASAAPGRSSASRT